MKNKKLSALTLLLFSLFILQAHANSLEQDSPAPSSSMNTLQSLLKTQERVEVIITLNTENAASLQRSATLVQRSNSAQSAARVASLLSKPTTRKHPEFKQFPLMTASVNQQELAALRQSPDVAGIQLNRRNKIQLRTSTVNIQAPPIWQAGQTGAGWAVAVLDTGIDTQHPFLAGKVIREACFSSIYDETHPAWWPGDNAELSLCPNGETQQYGPGAAQPTCQFEGCSHGTHIAGIIAGIDQSLNLRGVAPSSELISIQVYTRSEDLNACDPCIFAYDSDIIAGLEHVYILATEPGDPINIAAVNISTGSFQAYNSESSCEADYPAYMMAINNLAELGIAVVAASGNEGHSNAIASPACLPGVVSVASTRVDDNSISDFSNQASILDLYAPGERITSAVLHGQYADFEGTSMAVPHVAGCFALLRAQCPSETYQDHLQRMKTFSPGIIQARGDSKPRLDCAAAFRQLACTAGAFDNEQTSPSPTSVLIKILLLMDKDN